MGLPLSVEKKPSYIEVEELVEEIFEFWKLSGCPAITDPELSDEQVRNLEKQFGYELKKHGIIFKRGIFGTKYSIKGVIVLWVCVFLLYTPFKEFENQLKSVRASCKNKDGHFVHSSIFVMKSADDNYNIPDTDFETANSCIEKLNINEYRKYIASWGLELQKYGILYDLTFNAIFMMACVMLIMYGKTYVNAKEKRMLIINWYVPGRKAEGLFEPLPEVKPGKHGLTKNEINRLPYHYNKQ